MVIRFGLTFLEFVAQLHTNLGYLVFHRKGAVENRTTFVADFHRLECINLSAIDEITKTPHRIYQELVAVFNQIRQGCINLFYRIKPLSLNRLHQLIHRIIDLFLEQLADTLHNTNTVGMDIIRRIGVSDIPLQIRLGIHIGFAFGRTRVQIITNRGIGPISDGVFHVSMRTMNMNHFVAVNGGQLFHGEVVLPSVQNAIHRRFFDEARYPANLLGLFEREFVQMHIHGSRNLRGVHINLHIAFLKGKLTMTRISYTTPDDLFDTTHVEPRLHDMNLADVFEIQAFCPCL